MDKDEQRLNALVARLREISQFPSQLLHADIGQPPGHYPSIRFEFRPVEFSEAERQRVGTLLEDFVRRTEEPGDLAHSPQLTSRSFGAGPTGMFAGDLTLKTKDMAALEALVDKLAKHEKSFRQLMLDLYLKEHPGGLIQNNAASYREAHREAGERWAADQSLDYPQEIEKALLSKPDGARIQDLLKASRNLSPPTAENFIQESLRQEAAAEGADKTIIRQRIDDFAHYVPLFRSYIEDQRARREEHPLSSDTELGNSAGKADFTAWAVAKGITLLAEDPKLQELVDDPRMATLSQWFVDGVDTGHPLQPMLQDPSIPREKKFEAYQMVGKGMHVHYGTRKRFVEEQTRQAIAQGVDQVVVLAGGFDTLALRLNQDFPRVTFIEIDHPSTQREKLRVLEEHRRDPLAECGPNLHFLANDFTQRDLKDALLRHPGFKPGKRTLFIAEGLFMYLTPEDMERSLATMQELTDHQASTVFSTVNPQRMEDGELKQVLNQANAAQKSALSPPEVQAMLQRQGFKPGQRHSYHQLTGSRLEGIEEEVVGEDYYIAAANTRYRGLAETSRPSGKPNLRSV